MCLQLIEMLILIKYFSPSHVIKVFLSSWCYVLYMQILDCWKLSYSSIYSYHRITLVPMNLPIIFIYCTAVTWLKYYRRYGVNLYPINHYILHITLWISFIFFRSHIGRWWWTDFHKSVSAREPWTRHQFKWVINRRNVNTTVSKDYHVDSAFIDHVGEGHILSLPKRKAELVFVVSGTTNMYPGYGIVYKNVPIFWSLLEYVPCIRPHVPCVFKYRDRNHVTQFSASVTAIWRQTKYYHCTSKWIEAVSEGGRGVW